MGSAAAAMGLLTILFPVDVDPFPGPAAAAVAALLALASYGLFRLYELRDDLASEAKRLALLEWGSGWTLFPAARLHLCTRVGQDASRLAQRYLAAADTYYASDQPVRAARLLDISHESAFFALSLLRTLSTSSWSYRRS